ncbi:MAG: PKD domain-containing protein [Bacteroidales bacterium]|nr:PKD domain-containing protein [Bacteroidales bacterium]
MNRAITLTCILLICFKSFSQTFDFMADVTEGCSPQKVIFTNITDESIKNDYTYQWTVETGKSSNQTDSVQNTYLKPGAYDVTMKVYDKTGKTLIQTVSKSKYITIYNDPEVTIKSNKSSTCEDKAFQFSIENIKSDSEIKSYTWILSDGTIYNTETPPEHTFWFAGEFEVFLSVQDFHGCTNRERKSIKVVTYNDYPIVSFSASETKVCDSKLDVTFTNNSEDPNIVSYHWDFGDGATSNDKTPKKHTFNGYGNYYVELSGTAKSECVGYSVQTIQLIDFQPEIGIEDGYPAVKLDEYPTSSKDFPVSRIYDAEEKTSYCPGKITFFDASATKNKTWSWDFAIDGTEDSNEETYSVDIAEGGTYKVKLTVGNGTCTEKLVKMITVEDPLVLEATPTDAFYCALPANVDYSAKSNIPGTEFLWIMDKLSYSSGAEVSKSYSEEGVYSATLYALSPSYCRAVKEMPGNVEVTLPKMYTEMMNRYGNPSSGCAPLNVTFTLSYKYETDKDDIAFVSWDYNEDGIVEDYTYFTEPSKTGNLSQKWTYTEIGVHSYAIILETNKGCRIRNKQSYSEDSISVGLEPNVTMDFAKILCASDSLELIMTFDDKERYQSSYDSLFVTFTQIAPWPLSDGMLPEKIYTTIDQESPIEETFYMDFTDTVGLHFATYIVSDNGCQKEYTVDDPVLVQGPMIKLAVSETDCANPSKYTYSFAKNYSSEFWEWSVRSAAEETWTKIAGSENLESVDIDFDDYGGRGVYYVKASASNTETGCAMEDSISTTVTKVVADFKLVTYEPCFGDSAVFVVTEEMALENDIETWTWIYEWQDSTASHLFASYNKLFNEIDRYDYYPKSPRYVFDYSGINYVKVRVTDENGCSAETTKSVKVFEPKADFIGDIPSDCIPFTTEFTDNSFSEHEIIKRVWDFGNGELKETSDLKVTSEYSTIGAKSVSLAIEDTHGCRDTVYKENYIRPVVPNSLFFVNDPKVCLGYEAKMVRLDASEDYENNLSRYHWDFGDEHTEEGSGNIQDTTRYVYENEQKKNYTVTLTAYAVSPEGNECSSTTTQEVDVKDVATKIVVKDSDKCKEPGQKFIVYLDNSVYTSNMNSFAWWKIENGDSLYIGNKKSLQAVTFDNYGDQLLCLRTKSSYYGCEDATVKLPVVVSGYEVSLKANKTEVCVREDILLTLYDTLNLYRYNCYWEFGDGNSQKLESTETSYAYTSLAATEDNTYKVQFIVEAEGCKSRDISVNVSVFPVIADFTRGETDFDTIGCAPYSVILYNTSVANESATYLWEFQDGTTSTAENPRITVPDLDMVVPVTLSVTSNICNDKITKNVSTYPPASFSVQIDTSICLGETIHAEIEGDFSAIQWEPRDLFTNSRGSKTDVRVDKSQYLYMDFVNKYGCKSRDSVYVFVQQKPYYIGAPNELLLFYDANNSLVKASSKTNNLIAGQTYNLNVTEIAGVSYTWSPADYLSCSNCVSPDLSLYCSDDSFVDCIDLPSTLEYTITMVDSLGCFSNDTTIQFNIVFDTKIAMPEAFTPNGDGKNDIAYVRGWGIRELLELKIYNRWGQLVFETDNLAEGWDGTFNGEPQSMDTYAYTIKATNMKNEEIFVKGYITLIR